MRENDDDEQLLLAYLTAYVFHLYLLIFIFIFVRRIIQFTFIFQLQLSTTMGAQRIGSIVAQNIEAVQRQRAPVAHLPLLSCWQFHGVYGGLATCTVR